MPKPKPKPAKRKPESVGARGVQRSRDVTIAWDDLRAMLCSIQQIVDSADDLAACPSKIADWSVLRAKVKNARRKVDLMWAVLR